MVKKVTLALIMFMFMSPVVYAQNLVVSDNNSFELILLILPLVFLGYSLLCWFNFGKDEKSVPTIEFYPPKGLNSLDLAFIYNGKATSKDAASLLLYLANKGYVEITYDEEKTLLGKKKNFKIIKLKDYDGDDPNEKLFLEGLFSNKLLKIKGIGLIRYNKPDIELVEMEPGVNGINATIEILKRLKNGDYTEVETTNIEATYDTLYKKFNRTIKSILNNVNSKTNKSKYFEQNSKTIIMFTMILFLYLLLTVNPLLNSSHDTNITDTIWIITIMTTFFGIGFFLPIYSISNGDKFVNVIPILCFSTIWIGIWWFSSVSIVMMKSILYFLGYIISVIVMFIIAIIIRYMPKRTKYGREMYDKIEGFKMFLETTEKEKLESLSENNPNYFYDILPYTYVLGITSKWIKDFEDVSYCSETPDWCIGLETIDIVDISNFLDETFNIDSLFNNKTDRGKNLDK